MLYRLQPVVKLRDVSPQKIRRRSASATVTREQNEKIEQSAQAATMEIQTDEPIPEQQCLLDTDKPPGEPIDSVVADVEEASTTLSLHVQDEGTDSGFVVTDHEAPCSSDPILSVTTETIGGYAVGQRTVQSRMAQTVKEAG